MRQHGFTIIELLVGLLVAMLCLLMMLMLFKQTTKIGVHAGQDAQYNTQIQTGLLIAQKFIQNAGFGSSQPHDIQIVEEHPQVVYWRLVPEPHITPIRYECQGMVERISDQGTQKLHQLVLIGKPCGSNETWIEGQWQDQQVLVNILSQQNTPIFHYRLNEGNCTPYGINQKDHQGLKQLVIEARREHSDHVIKNLICLNNIVVS